MTSEELAKLEELEKAATPGPWLIERRQCDPYDTTEYPGIVTPNNDFITFMEEANTIAVAALRNAAPELIRSAREANDLRALLAKSRHALVSARAYFTDENGEPCGIAAGDAADVVAALDAEIARLGIGE